MVPTCYYYITTSHLPYQHIPQIHGLYHSSSDPIAVLFRNIVIVEDVFRASTCINGSPENPWYTSGIIPSTCTSFSFNMLQFYTLSVSFLLNCHWIISQADRDFFINRNLSTAHCKATLCLYRSQHSNFSLRATGSFCCHRRRRKWHCRCCRCRCRCGRCCCRCRCWRVFFVAIESRLARWSWGCSAKPGSYAGLYGELI